MIIRRAVPADRKRLLTLYAAFLETDRFADMKHDSFLEIVESKDHLVLVAEDDDRLMGFITASARLVVRYPHPIWQIDELYVDADSRGHGLGGKLIKEVEKLVRSRGGGGIYVQSGYQHEPAHTFYEHNGYEKRGHYFLKVL